MLPNLSNLAVDVSTKHGRSSKKQPDKRVKKLIQRGERRSAHRKLFSPTWDKWQYSIAIHFADDHYILADGIAYRCANTLYELFNGSDYPNLGQCLHMAWDEFHTYYGDTCAMFSTRALQNCGFTMMHGFRWGPRLLHIEENNDPSEYHSDWLLKLWVQSRRVATRDRLGWKDLVRPEDQFKEPTTYIAELLDRWEKGEWQIPEDQEWEWDEWWKTQTEESNKEFKVLSEEAVRSAPWWVLRSTLGGTPSGFLPELLEFSVRGGARGGLSWRPRCGGDSPPQPAPIRSNPPIRVPAS